MWVQVHAETPSQNKDFLLNGGEKEFISHHGAVDKRLGGRGLTWGTTPKAFLHLCRGTEFQETPSMEISPSVEARRSRAESRVLFPEPVRPSSPIYTHTHTQPVWCVFTHLILNFLATVQEYKE